MVVFSCKRRNAFDLYVCVTHVNGLRNYPIRLKFGTQILICYSKLAAQFLVYITQTGVLGYTKVSQYVTACREKILLKYFSMFRLYTKYTENYIHFRLALKHVTNRMWYEYHLQFVYRITQKSSDILVCMAINGWRFVSGYFVPFLNKFNLKSTIRWVTVHEQYTGQFKIGQIRSFLQESFVQISLNILN